MRVRVRNRENPRPLEHSQPAVKKLRVYAKGFEVGEQGEGETALQAKGEVRMSFEMRVVGMILTAAVMWTAAFWVMKQLTKGSK